MNVAVNFHHPELIPDWIAIVVGLHFLPLAKIFRAASMAFIGTAIVLWSIACWILFRGYAPRLNTLGAAAALGTGALLWISCVASLARARTAALSLSAVSASIAHGIPGR